MQPTPHSSNVDSVGYDPATQDLYVKFKAQERTDEPYVYRAVPPEVHAAMMKASSVGSYLHNHVKDVYRGEKLPKTK